MDRTGILVVGSGGRECAFAMSLASDCRVYAMMDHENPLMVDIVNRTGGRYGVGRTSDPDKVLRFAKEYEPEFIFVNSDEPLANGVVDELLEAGFKAVGATRRAAQIEWDKVYAMRLMSDVCPEFTPFYRVITAEQHIADAISEFKGRNIGIAVKPQGLTGGKGVRVMPEHLKTYEDCAEYARELLQTRPGESVLLVERLEGIEFTIMGITDGESLVISPASYDYPFRFEGDRGPGTGGMGCFTDVDKKLPFMSDADLDCCRMIMQRVIDEMRVRKSRFKGVLNGGFFKTASGIRFMEWNGRFGDPEGLNILSVMTTPLSEVLYSIWEETVSEDVISFAGKASVIKYVVAKEYPSASPNATDFEIDRKAIENLGVAVYPASCINVERDRYRTLKRSRVMAFGSVADSIGAASDLVNQAIDCHVSGNLDYRRDIGSTENVSALVQAAQKLAVSSTRVARP